MSKTPVLDFYHNWFNQPHKVRRKVSAIDVEDRQKLAAIEYQRLLKLYRLVRSMKRGSVTVDKVYDYLAVVDQGTKL